MTSQPRPLRPAISVIGTGYLGAVHAVALASSGMSVVAVDVDAERIAALRNGTAPFHEPGLPELLAEARSGGLLTFTTDVTAVANCDVHFLCVGTPQAPDGDHADLSAVRQAVDALADVAAAESVIVGKSTVPVGTAAAIQRRLRQRRGDRAPQVVWNPEFLREGFAIADTLRPDRIVVGADRDAGGRRAADLLREVYSDQIAAGVPYLEVDVATAELVKVAANGFLATKISFINAMAQVCEAAGADVVDLADAIGLDARIGRRFLNAGVGFGGGCLPKDIRAFAVRAEELGAGPAAGFLRWADDINQRQRRHVEALVAGLCDGDVTGRRVVVLGAAFKPDSDDVRDSPGLAVAAALHERGATVVVHDPRALASAARAYPDLAYEASLQQAIRGADVLVVATEWAEYRELDPNWLAGMVARRGVVDARNLWDPDKWRAAGWTYRGIGRRDPAAR